MEKIITLREGILIALVDDGESIIQIEVSLKEFKIPFTRDLVKEQIINLINEELVEIVFPPDKTIDDLIKSNNESIEAFWFELSKRGRKEWEKIDDYKYLD